MREWISAFDGLTLAFPDTGESIDMGEALREAEFTDSIDEDIEAFLAPVAGRIQALSEQLVEAASGWTGPADTGLSTPDVQFVAIPIGDEHGRVDCVFGPYSQVEEASYVAAQLSSDPKECQIAPVVQWVK